MPSGAVLFPSVICRRYPLRRLVGAIQAMVWLADFHGMAETFCWTDSQCSLASPDP